MKTGELLKIAAWPVETLHASPQGRITGLLMPKVEGKPIHQLYSPKSRLAEASGAATGLAAGAADAES